MINAKEELLSSIKESGATLRCAIIKVGYEEYDEPQKVYSLRNEYTFCEVETFLNSLDFTYDNGYGAQHLYGTVWLYDGTWLERREYDGSEWWNVCSAPTIPDELKQKETDF